MSQIFREYDECVISIPLEWEIRFPMENISTAEKAREQLILLLKYDAFGRDECGQFVVFCSHHLELTPRWAVGLMREMNDNFKAIL